VVTTITSEADAYAQQVLDELRAKGIRADIDMRNEKINYKVREHSLQKVPYLFVVGKREAEERTVAIRTLGSDGQKVINMDAAIEDLVMAARPPY
jgi:threonyl-tRNA synthetase